MSDRALTAIHEASHAIAAQSVGFTVEHATVHKTPEPSGRLGFVSVLHPRKRPTKDAVLAFMTYRLAGNAALRQDDQEDVSKALSVASEFTALPTDHPETKALYDEAKTRADAFVEANEEAIQVVAARLLEKGKLTGKEVMALAFVAGR